MRPIATDQVAWSVSVSADLLVCHISETCKTDWTDPGAVWAEDSGGPRGPCIVLDRGPDPRMEGAIFLGNGRPIVNYRDTIRTFVQK